MTLLDIINEDLGENFASIEDALNQYTARELLNGWLCYEGVIGYTDKLLGVMDDLGFFPAVHEDPHQPVDKRAERRRRGEGSAKESPNNQAAPYELEYLLAGYLPGEKHHRKFKSAREVGIRNIKTMTIEEMVEELIRRTSAMSINVKLGDEVTLKPGEPTQILAFPISWMSTTF